LNASWSDFKNYYAENRGEAVGLLLRHLCQLLGVQCQDLLALSREEVGETVYEPGILRYYLGKWVANRKASWTFPWLQIHFIASNLNSFLAVLALPEKPHFERLISLRMDFCLSEFILESRCHGWAELNQAKRIEHFQQTEWLPTVRVEEILGTHQDHKKPTARQSA
jgi:hypothetical protein